MQSLDRPGRAVVDCGPHELRSQPVEQLGVRWGIALEAKVVWGANETLPEVMLPNAVDQHPGRERVFRVGDPAGELQPPMCRFAVGRRRGERLVERRDGGEKTGRNFRPGLVPFALLQQPDWLGCGAQICPPVDIKAELLLGRAALIGLPDRPCPEKLAMR